MLADAAPSTSPAQRTAEPLGRRNRGQPKNQPSAVRKAQKELTRALLATAAQAQFEERGYVEVTVDDIVRAAGASRATFYLYFESKAAVLQEVLRKLQLREEYQLLLRHFAAIEEPTVDALQAWLDEYVDFYVKHRGLHRAIHQAQAVEPEFAHARLGDIRLYIELWRSLGFVKNPDSDDLRLAAMMMFALADETLYLWLVDGFEADRRKVTRALAESFHATLQRG
jgi:AcrR family transcriptional regulator